MKSEYINCKNCKDDCHCKGKDITPICISFKPAKTTNADRIRSMTDENLAIFLDDVQKYNICCKPIICDDCADCMTDLCWQCWHNWLKQEVKNNE